MKLPGGDIIEGLKLVFMGSAVVVRNIPPHRIAYGMAASILNYEWGGKIIERDFDRYLKGNPQLEKVMARLDQLRSDLK